MFAKTMKSSSPLVNSRQLFRLNNTASSLNSLEHAPPLEPREQPQPFCKNFFALSIIWLGFSSLSKISPSPIFCHFCDSKSVIYCHGNCARWGDHDYHAQTCANKHET